MDAGRKRRKQGDAPVLVLCNRKVARAALTPDATLYRVMRLWVADSKTAALGDKEPPPVDFYSLPAPELAPHPQASAQAEGVTRRRKRDAVEREVLHAAEQRDSEDLLRAHVQRLKHARRNNHRQSAESVVKRLTALETRTTVHVLK